MFSQHSLAKNAAIDLVPRVYPKFVVEGTKHIELLKITKLLSKKRLHTAGKIWQAALYPHCSSIRILKKPRNSSF